ncbi:MAG: P1 family peptidase [Candidatus Marinimicrobia bacterium]|nr:P1 family peptidase [Candidatus Neomarinimicrobiota bacterium]MCF7828189.1 P1 family peptidase [Candidatus Neomarinimicrobiota bacterium]MCF7879636.1 P1 family peptidase [Candidatus Neomarinimicrobiota bacterium]
MAGITDVTGVIVGHSTNTDDNTGCTVILFEDGAVAGADVRGSATGTVEIEVLKPVRLVPKINGLFFTGGSALGLPAVKGVLDFLRENDIGYETGNARIPIVPGAVIYDISEDKNSAIPTAEMAYEASEAAKSEYTGEGTVGVGTGATVGNMFGPELTRRGGLATLSDTTPDGITVGVLLVANPFGGIFSPWENRWLVGHEKTEESLLYKKPEDLWTSNTTLIAVATDAQLTKEQCIKVSQMAQDGLARVVSPAHSMFDGDLSVTASLGEKQGEINGIGHLAAELTSKCIIRAVELSNDTDVLS